MCFKGRMAMITGGASGMGSLAGQKQAEAGANVVLCDVNHEAQEAAAAGIRAAGGGVLPLVVDIRKYPEVEAAEKKAVVTCGAVDILVNCAGGMSGRCCQCNVSFERLPIEVIDWGIDVNGTPAPFVALLCASMRENKSWPWTSDARPATSVAHSPLSTFVFFVSSVAKNCASARNDLVSLAAPARVT